MLHRSPHRHASIRRGRRKHGSVPWLQTGDVRPGPRLTACEVGRCDDSHRWIQTAARPALTDARPGVAPKLGFDGREAARQRSRRPFSYLETHARRRRVAPKVVQHSVDRPRQFERVEPAAEDARQILLEDPLGKPLEMGKRVHVRPSSACRPRLDYRAALGCGSKSLAGAVERTARSLGSPAAPRFADVRDFEKVDGAGGDPPPVGPLTVYNRGAMTGAARVDQRLRVFISVSDELDEERAAARQAIAGLRLTPVVSGTPADSDIFVGIYGQEYGPVVPDDEISSIERDYRASRGKPRLIYLKEPAPARHHRLKTLLEQIRDGGAASYQKVASIDELRERIANDLALLLTEQFMSAPAALPTSAAPRPNAPPRNLTPLLGREAELALLARLLDDPASWLVTLIGPGGVGKTSLALEAAHRLASRFPDGVVWAPLATVRDPAIVVAAIAKALDVPEQAGAPLVATVAERLREKRLLVVIDNVEQVVAAAPDIAALFETTQHAKALVTSRAPLRLRGEREVHVSPLALPPAGASAIPDHLAESAAVQLFVERARRVVPRFALDAGNAAAVAEIVCRLDGLPLAIELAAARLRLLSPHALLERLDSALTILTSGHRDAPPRQQTIRNTVDWSYQLLDPESARLFRRLGVFVGQFGLAAAEAVAASDRESIVDGLEALVEHSLLQYDSASDEPRYWMLETIREFALEQLAATDEAQEVRDRHARFFLALVGKTPRRFAAPRAKAWLDRIEPEYANVRAAIGWLQSRPETQEQSWDLIISLGWLWYQRNYLSEARQWYRRALDQAASRGRDATYALLLSNAGILALWQGETVAARQMLEEAIAIQRSLGGGTSLADALFSRGVLAVSVGDRVAARAFLLEAAALFHETGDTWFETGALMQLGNVDLADGNLAGAQRVVQQALGLAVSVGDDWATASVLQNLGEIARAAGRLDEAERHYLESQANYERFGAPLDLARVHHCLAFIALARGETSRARILFRESLQQHRTYGVRRGVVEALLGLACVAAAEGQVVAAARAIGSAGAELEALGISWWPADQVELDRWWPRIVAALGEEAAAEADAGRALPLDEAIARLGEAVGP
ncbi:MAG: hypothetical protein KatS3mg060_0464 [Dehalococcoidia bacterium]|nr:MAG: hypothetical protein KatS3mg060_0464 [Dehalococcoidia bacterium]